MSGIASALGQAQAPRNVEQIVAAAQDYPFDARISLTRWLHTAHALLRQVCISPVDLAAKSDSGRRAGHTWRKAMMR